MKSRTTKRFRDLYEGLSDDVKAQANEAYRRFKRDPYHNSLRFKESSGIEVCGLRVSDDYRVLGTRDGDEITWAWIGTHRDYDKRF